MTDPTATANGNDTATTADNEPAPPDAAALAKESADYKDKLLRTLADMENLRRRTDREVADARAYGVSNFARDIVAVSDNIARATGALHALLRAKTEAGGKARLHGAGFS